MKRITLLLTAIVLACASADAQSLLERLGQHAKNAAENNVGNKVEQGVNELLNGKLGNFYAAQDSLMIAKAVYGLGRWYHEAGQTTKALEYLAKAEEYFGEHAREESFAHADTLAIMNDAHKDLYRKARRLAFVISLLLALAVVAFIIAYRLKKTKRELTETSAVLDETIEELRQAEPDGPVLNDQERAIARLLVEGNNTKEIAEAVHLGVNTVLWYRKRLYAKFDVHNAAAFSTEISRRGLLE